MKNLVWAVAALIIVLVVIFVFASKSKQNADTVIPTLVETNTPSPDVSNLDVNSKPADDKKMQVPFPILEKEEIEGKKVRINTDKGDIVFALFSDSPIAASNFIDLVNKKFYDKLIFHRVIAGFMIQGGDPAGNGSGGPGYSFPDEPVNRSYTRGIVAMANAGPNTNGSQFFVMHNDYQLAPNYTIFGNIISGIEVVDEIANSEVDENDKPKEPVVIKKVTFE